VWAQLAFPFYMQNGSDHKPDVCKEFEDSLRKAQGGAFQEDRTPCVWRAIRCALLRAICRCCSDGPLHCSTYRIDSM
jgi:hypothetical protein